MKMTPSFKILYTSATLASQKKAERNYCFDGVDAFNMNPPHTDPRAAPHLTRAVRQQISHLFPSASSKNRA